MSTITRWWWVRHAPSMGGQGIIHGQDNVNANLSDTGAIKRLGKRLPKDGLWFSSNIRRTIETAKEISGGVIPTEIPEFAEQHFGQWNGLKWKELPKKEMDNKHKGIIEEVIYHGDHTRVRVNILDNKNFIERAPKHIVEQEKNTYNELKIDIDKINLTIKSLT